MTINSKHELKDMTELLQSHDKTLNDEKLILTDEERKPCHNGLKSKAVTAGLEGNGGPGA